MHIKFVFCLLITSSCLFSEALVRFDFNGGLNHDVLSGADPQSSWAVPTNAKVGFLPDLDGDDTFTLSNDGTKPTYYGGSYGNAHRAEWGLTYNATNSGNESSIGGNKKGNIKDGFSISSGEFTVFLNITDWDLTSEGKDSSIVFKARTKDNVTVAGFKIMGDVSTGNTTLQGIIYNPNSIHGKPLNKLSKLIKADSLTGTVSDIKSPMGLSINYDTQTYTIFANGSSTTIEATDGFADMVIEKVRLSTENFAQPNSLTFDAVSFIRN
jgi:hypothetical protein